MLQPLAASTEQVLPKFDGHALATTVNGLANLHASGWSASDALWVGLATHGTSSVRKLNAQELTNTVRGFAKVGRVETALFDAVAEELAERGLHEFTPQGLSNTAWAYAAAGHNAPALFDAASHEAVQLGLRKFKPQELANTAWAYAKAGHAAPALLDAIAREATPRLCNFTAQCLANTAWAYATTSYAAPALFDAIAKEAAQRGLREFKPQELSNTAWAFAAADHPAPALFGGDDFAQRCEAEHGFVPMELSQLHQWQLWQEERGAAWPPLPPELAQRCRAAFSQEGVPSRLQSDVAASLRSLGLAPQEEVRTPQGYSLDAVVSHGGREVAVEVDGPSHFVGRTPTGATALKRRQLRAAGWALLPVPYWEWSELGSNTAEKQEYLRAALEGLGEPAGGGRGVGGTGGDGMRGNVRDDLG